MRESPSLGFGGFLLGLGVGWLIFRNLEISHENFAYLIIIFGIGIDRSIDHCYLQSLTIEKRNVDISE